MTLSAPGLRLLLDQIRAAPEEFRTLSPRYLALLSDLPDGQEKSAAVLDLAEVALGLDTKEAVRLAHMVWQHNRRHARAIDLIARAMEAQGKLGKAAVLRQELSRLDKGPSPSVVFSMGDESGEESEAPVSQAFPSPPASPGLVPQLDLGFSEVPAEASQAGDEPAELARGRRLVVVLPSENPENLVRTIEPERVGAFTTGLTPPELTEIRLDDPPSKAIVDDVFAAAEPQPLMTIIAPVPVVIPAPSPSEIPSPVADDPAPMPQVSDADEARSWGTSLDTLIQRGDPLAAWWEVRRVLSGARRFPWAREAMIRMEALRQALQSHADGPVAFEWIEEDGMRALAANVNTRKPWALALRRISCRQTRKS